MKRAKKTNGPPTKASRSKSARPNEDGNKVTRKRVVDRHPKTLGEYLGITDPNRWPNVSALRDDEMMREYRADVGQRLADLIRHVGEAYSPLPTWAAHVHTVLLALMHAVREDHDKAIAALARAARTTLADDLGFIPEAYVVSTDDLTHAKGKIYASVRNDVARAARANAAGHVDVGQVAARLGELLEARLHGTPVATLYDDTIEKTSQRYSQAAAAIARIFDATKDTDKLTRAILIETLAAFGVPKRTAAVAWDFARKRAAEKI